MQNSVAAAILSASGEPSQRMIGGGANDTLQISAGESVSLNISPSSVESFFRVGNDLVLQLIDGQSITLADWFDPSSVPHARLYLSTDGMISEMRFVDEGGGVLLAEGCLAPNNEAWGSLNDLRFDCRDALIGRVEAHGVSSAGSGYFSLLGLGSAVLGALALSGGGGGHDGSSSARAIDGSRTTTSLTPDFAGSVQVTGTGHPGETVVVAIGTSSKSVLVKDDGRWVAEFLESELPADGTYKASAKFEGNDGPIQLTGGTFLVDLDPPQIQVTDGFKSNGSVENLAEYQDGVTLQGKTDPGTAVNVTLGVPGQQGAITRSVTVSSDGTWTVTFPTDQIAGGEREQVATITATNRYGQSSTATDLIVLDTIAPPLTLGAVSGNDIVNRSERGSEIIITGTASPGAEVRVVIQGMLSVTVTANSKGEWSRIIPASAFPEGDYNRQITVATTDAAGNETVISRELDIDTVAPTLPQADLRISTGTDTVLNAQERLGGLPVSGTAEAGSTVSVTMNGFTRTATAGQNGAWSVTFSADQIPQGEVASVPVSVTAQDQAGNTSVPVTASYRLDTVAPTMTEADLRVGTGTDTILNAQERLAGLPVSGNAEAGSTVSVTMNGFTRTTTAGQNGAWSVTFSPDQIPRGEIASVPVSVTSRDQAGNTSVPVTANYRLDTVAPTLPEADLRVDTGTDTIVNAQERLAGLPVSGSAEAGSTVSVTMNGFTRTATAGQNGAWSVTFSSDQIPQGEIASVPVSVTTRDLAGNTTGPVSANFRLDTVGPALLEADLRISTGTDTVLNAQERLGGLPVAGTAEAGSTVSVTMNGFTRTATAGQNGAWSVTFSADQIPQGEVASVPVSVTARDQAGNTTGPVSASYHLDTVATLSEADLRISTGNDNIVNAQERLEGLPVSGKAEAGSTVSVTMNGFTRTATAGQNGAWSVAFTSDQIPQGEIASVPVSVSARDQVGNTTGPITANYRLDTVAPTLPEADLRVNTGSDTILNAQERLAGLPVSGSAEAGSTVSVTMNGFTRMATAGQNGAWSVTFSSDQIPQGEIASVPVSVVARDHAGNTSASVTAKYQLDTVLPEFPVVIAVNDTTTTTRSVSTAATTETYDFYRIDATGPAIKLSPTVTQETAFGETVFRFQTGQELPNGSFLVISNDDPAGNMANTLLVKNSTSGVAVDLTREGLNSFDLSLIDLTRAQDARLTISAQQLEDIVAPDHRLFITGEASDHITLLNVTSVNENVSVNGGIYDIYTLGSNGAQVLLEDELSRTVV